MIALARRLRAIGYSRYLAVSVAALSVDLGLFLLLQAAAVPVSLTSAASYGAGILVHWLLSSRIVFAAELRAPGADRARQQMMFLASALVGLAVTVAIVGAASMLIDPRLAKLIAIAASFQVTWLLRSRIVFA